MSDNEPVQAEPVEYEERLRDDSNLSLREVSDYFESRGTVLATLRNLARAVDSAGIPYAVIGALALREHGFVRATVDIDLLTTPDGLQAIHEKIVGLGFRPAFSGARKKYRSTETGVKVDVFMEGEYPGDGKPKAIRFPDPAEASFESNGIRYLKLEQLRPRMLPRPLAKSADPRSIR